MATDDEMLELLGAALMDDVPSSPREQDVARLRDLVTARQDEMSPVATLSSRRPRLHLQHLATAAAIVAAFAVGVVVARDGGSPSDDSAGVVEFTEEITSTGDGRVDVIGRRLEIGRTVEIRSDSFPILPVGEFYEVWFVAANDMPTRLNRISAGTFHPDLEGRTVVTMTAAVDPTKFPTLVITAEIADGDPAPSTNEVMRGSLTILD